MVGAGPGGLAAAMLLAAAGARVTVFERDVAIGGRTRTLEAPGGFRFDLGPTFFLYPRILAEIFARCGARLDDEVVLRRLDPQYRLVFEGDGAVLDAVPDPARMEAGIARLCRGDAQGLRSFLAENRAKLAAFQPVLKRAFGSPADLFRPGMLRALRLLRPHRSVDADLIRHFRDPRVRLAFSFQAKYLGMSPFRCPSLFTILAFLEYEHGVFHPLGGCGAISSAMARVAERLGAEFRLGEPVVVPAAGMLELAPSLPATLDRRRWCRTSATWVSVTPVALDRYPRDLRSTDPARREEAERDAEVTLARACVHAGLPEPVVTTVRFDPPLPGSAPVGGWAKQPGRRFPPYRAGSSGTVRPCVHAHLTFPEPVAGPVLIGAGRYHGYGLFLPR